MALSINKFVYACGNLLALLLLTHSVCYGSSTPAEPGSKSPWFTGPLLTPTAFTLPPGVGNVEPYVFWKVTNGVYNKEWNQSSVPHLYRLNPQFTYKFGLVENIDFSGTIESVAGWTKGASGVSFGDLPIGFGIQLFELDPGDDVALCKLTIQETFPTGRYQKLNPRKYRTDIGGEGSFATQVGICFSKQFKFKNDRFFRGRLFLSSTYSAPVHVRGFNVYGGDATTKGTVYPGFSHTLLTSGEYTVTKNWTLACDLQASYSDKQRFSGRTQSPNIALQSLQFSLAPAIEYNWNEQIGVIVGPWFTFAGRNSKRFISAVAAVNYNF